MEIIYVIIRNSMPVANLLATLIGEYKFAESSGSSSFASTAGTLANTVARKFCNSEK